MAQTAQLRAIDVVENEAQRVFKLQREAYTDEDAKALAEYGI